MGNRPQGLHVKSNSFYPLRPEPEVSKARTVRRAGAQSRDETRDKAAGAAAGVPSAGRSPGRAPRRCGCTAHARVAASREDRGWRCSPSQDRPRLDLPRPRLRRPGLPPSPRRRPEPLLPGAHAPSPASCGCTSSAVGRGPELRGGARGGRTLEAEGRARGAGNGRQRQAGRAPAHNPQTRTHLRDRRPPRAPGRRGVTAAELRRRDAGRWAGRHEHATSHPTPGHDWSRFGRGGPRTWTSRRRGAERGGGGRGGAGAQAPQLSSSGSARAGRPAALAPGPGLWAQLLPALGHAGFPLEHLIQDFPCLRSDQTGEAPTCGGMCSGSLRQRNMIY